ncbi:hypothetical protein A464_743 [Salmonella bongori N268-08]|uniref:Uncharacterized protein n=1 Tax=Salmonella bongori N268-08 TaxID=1197719 RepID=S5MTG8_SALBN|nr:hypothetical protein A464_743 [Salmonella bongori N268-08]
MSGGACLQSDAAPVGPVSGCAAGQLAGWRLCVSRLMP